MKKILLTTTALIAFGIAPAAAADMAARPYTKAPAAIVINSWSGFYLGAMGGYAQENSSGIGTLSGGFAGGTAGYNWQMGNTRSRPRGRRRLGRCRRDVFPFDARIRDMGTVRGRLGYAFDSVLLYGTGGYAWAENRLSVPGLSDSEFLSGWTVGAGVEVMFAPRVVGQGGVPLQQLGKPTYFSDVVPGGVPIGTINLNSVQVGVNYHF